jgi:hypothetical protein
MVPNVDRNMQQLSNKTNVGSSIGLFLFFIVVLTAKYHQLLFSAGPQDIHSPLFPEICYYRIKMKYFLLTFVDTSYNSHECNLVDEYGLIKERPCLQMWQELREISCGPFSTHLSSFLVSVETD